MKEREAKRREDNLFFLLTLLENKEGLSILLTEFQEQKSPFEALLSNFKIFTVRVRSSEYIYSTLTLHKYRNNNYST